MKASLHFKSTERGEGQVGSIVMLIVLIAMNSFAIWLRNRYEQRW